MVIQHSIDLQFHYGGRFSRGVACSYDGGAIEIRKNVDPDVMGYLEFGDYLVDMGESPTSFIYYVVPGQLLHNGLRLLQNDADVVFMLELYHSLRVYTIMLYVVKEPLELNVLNPPALNAIAMEESVRGAIGETSGGPLPENANANYDYGRETSGTETDEDFAIPREDREDDNTVAPVEHDIREVIVEGGDWDEDALDDGLCSLVGLEDEEETNRYAEYSVEVDGKRPRLLLGMKFPNVNTFRECLLDYAANHGIKFEYKLNNPRKVSVHCIYGCGWRLYASKLSDEETFQVKTFHPSCTCPRGFTDKHLTSTFLAKKYLHVFKDNGPKWEVSAVQRHVMRDIAVDIPTHTAYRAKRKAQQILDGDESRQYGLVYDYANMVLSRDVGSQVKIKCDASMEGSPPIFERIYIRFNAQKVGFLSGYRPIVGLDGCFLKGKYGGHMLAAIGRDGNENIFPIAIAVVESECEDSWRWFLQIFGDDIGDPGELGLVFISDRQKGLDKALEDLFPTCEHRYCVRHLYENFRKKFSGQEYKEAMWAIANATTRRDWESKVRAMKNLSEAAWEWLAKIPASRWCKSHFSSRAMCDSLVNNLNESFNHMILKARGMPIITMLKWYRLCLMKRFSLKRDAMQKYEKEVCPNILRRMDKLTGVARNYSAIASGSNMYEVDNGFDRHAVDLNAHTCTCRAWELEGLPCRHATATILRNFQRPEQYIHECYRKSTYLRVYQSIITPMPGKEEWPQSGHVAPAPPIFRPQPGRPKKSRKRGENEPRNPNAISRRNRVKRCGKCAGVGHNSRSCHADSTGPTMWQRRLERQRDNLLTRGSNRGRRYKRGRGSKGRGDTPSTATRPPTCSSQPSLRISQEQGRTQNTTATWFSQPTCSSSIGETSGKGRSSGSSESTRGQHGRLGARGGCVRGYFVYGDLGNLKGRSGTM